MISSERRLCGESREGRSKFWAAETACAKGKRSTVQYIGGMEKKSAAKIEIEIDMVIQLGSR